MKKGAGIRYAITKEVPMYSFVEWLESWGIDREDWDKFMEAGKRLWTERMVKHKID